MTHSTPTAAAQTRPITLDCLALVCFVLPWMSERRPDGNLLLISCQLTSDDEAIILQWRKVMALKVTESMSMGSLRFNQEAAMTDGPC